MSSNQLVVCGTASHRSASRPGAPSNVGGISATGIFGGIRVNWSLPASNPTGVAYYKVFKGTTSRVNNSTEIATVNANFYEDYFDGRKRFFYWVAPVALDGKILSRVGPASATSEDKALDYIKNLQQSINESFLAEHLRKDIELIQLNKLGITQEMIERAKSDDALAVSLDEIRAFNGDNFAAIQNEALARVDEREAFASTVRTLMAKLGENTAAIQEEKVTRTTKTEALALQLNTAQTVLGDNISSVQLTMESKISLVDGEVKEIGALYSARLSVNGLVGGFGIYNDGTTIDAGFDVDRFWIGSSQRKYKPFIISGDNIFFNGKVTFSNINGAGDLASKNSLTYSELDGQVAIDVKDHASNGNAAKGRVDTWTKTGTTSIDGGVIRSDSAWVGELFIKNNAVTIPRESFTRANIMIGTGDWTIIQSVYISSMHANSSSSVSFSFRIDYSFDSSAGQETFDLELIYTGESNPLWAANNIKLSGIRGHIPVSGTRLFGRSGGTFTLRAKKVGDKVGAVAVGYRSISVMGVKK